MAVLTFCFIAICGHKAGSYYNKQIVLREELEEAKANLVAKRKEALKKMKYMADDEAVDDLANQFKKA